MEVLKEGGVTAAKGFKAANIAAGIKYKDRDDMAMIYSETPCVSAGTYTTNKVKAACVKWDKAVTDGLSEVHAVVVNAGVANACTGEEGFQYCRETAKAVSELLPIASDGVCVASTGVIGRQLPMDKIKAGVNGMVPLLDDSLEAGHKAARAIMTTDTVPKEVGVTIDIKGTKVTIGGMCKGSGMIHPNMCTMLGFITTDCAISKELLQAALSTVIVDTYNMVTVDGDTSTNDTVLLLANGLAGNEPIETLGEDYDKFLEALYYVNETLAKKIAKDGEGASALFECKVVNASTKDQAVILAKSVVGSNLSKAAIFGHDANCGRFICAMGYSGADFDPDKTDLYFESRAGKIKVVENGVALEVDEDFATKILSEDEVTVLCDVKDGDASATAWGCDLTFDYVKINADYRS